MSAILQTIDITKQYSSHKALDNVSISIPEGTVYGLLGPNGAGKTSLIRIINQITGPDSGKVLFNNEDLKPEHCLQIGYLPEERGLYKKMEVGEQCVYLAQLKGLSRPEAIKRLKYWFEKFEIKDWWRKKVEELSKGMQQKVQFIVTVIHQPRLLILDEPFTGFDPINAELIKDELLLMKEQGTSIVLSTHRLESIEELCSHITLINKSKKLLEGSISEIREQFRTNTYIVDYIGHNIALANSLWGGYELLETVKHDTFMRATIRLTDNVTTNNLLENLLPNVSIIGFRELMPTINEIFIQSVNQTNQATTTHE